MSVTISKELKITIPHFSNWSSIGLKKRVAGKPSGGQQFIMGVPKWNNGIIKQTPRIM
jgi:hypothetical protein